MSSPHLLFAWCLHSGCLLWGSFFLWRSCWSSLQNSTSSLFLLDSRLAVSGCVPAASISFLSWWSTKALFLWSYTVYCWIFYVATGSQSPFSTVFYKNCLVFSGHSLTHPRFCSCTTVHFSLASRTAGFWLSDLFSSSFSRLCHSLHGQLLPILFLSGCLADHQVLIPVLSHLSILFSSSLDPLFMVVYSVFSLFTNRFLLFIFFLHSHRSCPSSFVIFFW